MRSATAVALLFLLPGLPASARGISQSDAKALSSLERECLGGDASACGSLGAMYRAGKLVEKDLAKSAMFYLRACAEASPSNPWCRESGAGIVLAQQSDEAALESAVEALASSCETGAGHDCNVLGFVYGSGKIVAKDSEKAIALYMRACAGKAPAGCSNLGDAYISGNGAPKDAGKALEFYGRACSGGFASGCADAGQIYLSGAVAGGASKAAPLFRTACDGGDGYGCASSGHLATGAKGGAENLLAAVRDFKKSCDLGSPAGCQGLVAIYGTNPEGAAALFREACGDDAKQCRQFDALVEGIQGADAFRRR